MPFGKLRLGDVLCEDDNPQSVAFVLALRCLREQHSDRCGKETRDRARVRDTLVEVATGAETRHQRHARAGDQRAHGRVILGIPVEQWQHDEVPVFRAQTYGLGDGFTRVDIIGISHHDSFGPCRRSRRVENGDIIERLDISERRGRVVSGQQAIKAAAISCYGRFTADNHRLHTGAAMAHRFDRL